MTDTFHGEQKILQLTFESRCEETFQGHIKETFEDFKSRLLKKFLNKENSEHRGVTSKPNVHPNNLISRYAPGSSANIIFVHHQPSTLCGRSCISLIVESLKGFKKKIIISYITELF